MDNNKYDLAIIGSGPAGLSASVYASRYGIKHIIIGEVLGGLVSETNEIGNWLGNENISSFDFIQNAQKHVLSYGTKIINSKVEKIVKEGDIFNVKLSGGENIYGKTILIATGTKHRHLGITGEEEFSGHGVSYCATCDGYFYRNKKVAVIGGNDSAAVAALHLANLAEKVYLIYRGNELRAEKIRVEALKKNPKIEIIYNTNLTKFFGENVLRGVALDKPYQNNHQLDLDGVFIEIGSSPDNDLLSNLSLKTDKDGYIIIDSAGKTTELGIWAAGDITTGSNKFRQIITAASEGAIAAQSISEYLKK